MSLVPEFELGLFNAWIFVLSFLLLFFVFSVLDRLRGHKGSSACMHEIKVSNIICFLDRL